MTAPLNFIYNMNERSFIRGGCHGSRDCSQRGVNARRDQIIQVARQLFVQQGYHGTSMRQIARQAGIALGGVYNHFSSKEDVFKAVFLENHPYHQVLPALLEAQGESIEELVANASPPG